ncbi:hypothetical protein, partial [Xanthomonas citri]|uniref:hypothetical protein n=1 Tax=Xanthomonas citri TaxID=346 RepID=UPI003F7D7217
MVAADLRKDALDPSQCVSRWRVRPEPSAFAVLQMCAIGTEHALLHVYVVASSAIFLRQSPDAFAACHSAGCDHCPG